MVQKYQSPVRVFKHPFELVMCAYERRFPTCKQIPVFLGSDITSEYNSDDGAITIIERKCRLHVDAPYILKKLAGVDHVVFTQRNALDRKKRCLHIEANNDSFSSRIMINEHCLYTVHPENSEWTCFEQDASLDVKSFFGFEHMVEKIAMKQYTANIKKGKEVIEHFINELIEEGITTIPRWLPPTAVPNEDMQAGPSSQCVVVGEAIAAVGGGELGLGSCSWIKMDADYIQRFLGCLSPYEESKLVQLKNLLAETYKGKIPKDAHILRFLRAREFNLERSHQMICHSLAWRKRFQIDHLIEDYNAPQLLQQYYSGGWHNEDKDGRPLYILRLGQMDVKGLIKSVGEDAMLKHVLYANEESIHLCDEATKKHSRPITNCTCLVDLEGLSMRHLWRPGVRALLRIIEIVGANYPETMGRLLIVRAPRVFPVLWTLVSPFIDENTSKKFLIYGGKDYQGKGGLVDYIPKTNIPDFLGGDCYCTVSEGGPVPKQFYTSDDETDRSPEESPFVQDGLYQMASVVKDYPHEVLLHVPQKGCVLTWDFDILKGDLLFTVLRSRKSLSSEPHEHHLGNTVISTQYLPKHWQIGEDLAFVENPVECHDGDSVQGSHVVGHSGTYVLQWRHLETGKGLFMHKAKVMYSAEVLQSASFRGSMSSLHSAQSGFSQLSCSSHSDQSKMSSGPSSCFRIVSTSERCLDPPFETRTPDNQSCIYIEHR